MGPCMCSNATNHVSHMRFREARGTIQNLEFNIGITTGGTLSLTENMAALSVIALLRPSLCLKHHHTPHSGSRMEQPVLQVLRDLGLGLGFVRVRVQDLYEKLLGLWGLMRLGKGFQKAS